MSVIYENPQQCIYDELVVIRKLLEQHFAAPSSKSTPNSGTPLRRDNLDEHEEREDAAKQNSPERTFNLLLTKYVSVLTKFGILEQQAADDKLAFTHAQEVIARQEATIEELKAENERLSAGVSIAELKRHGIQGLSAVTYQRSVNALIAARATYRSFVPSQTKRGERGEE